MAFFLFIFYNHLITVNVKELKLEILYQTYIKEFNIFMNKINK